MNFELSEEQIAVKEAARDFAQNVLKPGVIERDNLQKFPAEEMKLLGELGFMGMMIDPKYGGSGMDTISYVLAIEEISKVDASASVYKTHLRPQISCLPDSSPSLQSFPSVLPPSCPSSVATSSVPPFP